jgi:hypothetical protein
VQRRERRQRAQRVGDARVEPNGAAEPLAAVDDAVRDGVHVGRRIRERIDPGRPLSVDERELQARRAGVDD